MRGRLIPLYIASVSIAYLVVLFLHWSKPHGDEGYEPDSRAGLETYAFLSLPVGLALVVWELLDAGRVRRTAGSDALVSFFLAILTAGIGISAIVNLSLDEGIVGEIDLTTAAWVAAGLEALLLVAGALRLRQHIAVSKS